ncbi:MAG: phosphoenolpyruvate--protein phosphotransferase [Bacteroides sp.]|nr:phosphoenolpyruvate--protein phosphotransferase [Prevotella sp.]MCM1408804.1 phosphoenolpyruvate--protein phosphotransferase [Treponema brennaborense]MCM1470584.1 phosphoenolpyruvate--protein phosphotransferase [Bacteroides sp.]
MKSIRGTAVSPGIGTGLVVFHKNCRNSIITAKRVSKEQHEDDWKRFISAISKTKKYFQSLLDAENDEQSEIFKTHILMLEDTVFISQVQQAYNLDTFNIEYVIQQQAESIAGKLRAANDTYLNDRAADILDVFGKVIQLMQGYPLNTISAVTSGTIIAAQTLQVSDAIGLFQKKIAGLILAEGGINSHLAILARSYSIPTVFGVTVPNQTKEAIIDGTEGVVVCDPDSQTSINYQKKKQQGILKKKQFQESVRLPVKTKDGVLFHLYANIGTVEEAIIALKEGAEGIGLFRTEFLFMQAAEKHEKLDEDMQFNAYKEVLQIMNGRSVIIRTLDAGGDKIISKNLSAAEENPLLGNRGIRFCLSHKDIFKTQLRALMRAGLHGNLKIMLPMISDINQIEETKNLIAEITAEFDAENISYKTDIPIGIMVETPAAAVLADCFAQKCDFFSIGTNDLTQYTLSVDRENIFVNNLFNDCDKAVIRLIQNVYDHSEKAHIPISVCGEIAGRLDGIRHLAKIGIRSLSMSIHNISEIRDLIISHTLDELCRLN